MSYYVSRPNNFSWQIRGKLAGSAEPRIEKELLWLREQGIGAIVCLNQRSPCDDSQVRSLGFEYLHLPIKDFGVPESIEDVDDCISFIQNCMEREKAVAVHCEQGIGRTGMVLTLCLIAQGVSPREAIRQVEMIRGDACVTGEQVKFVHQYSERKSQQLNEDERAFGKA
jgi:protein tyrosine/serine phosphatase